MGILILTLATFIFSFLQQHYEDVQHFEGGNESRLSIVPMLLVVGSACSSALASLVSEKALKGEDLPFHIQKVRLDLGSAVVSAILFFVIGNISSRPQDAFWKDRPLSMTCDTRCHKI